jgi:hypothetical protein
VAPALPEGWETIKPWSIMLTSGDLGGWQYSIDFGSKSWHQEQGFGSKLYYFLLLCMGFVSLYCTVISFFH